MFITMFLLLLVLAVVAWIGVQRRKTSAQQKDL